MTVSPRVLVVALGAVAVVAGLLILLLPVTATVTGYPVRCGSAVAASHRDVQGSVLGALRIDHVVPIAEAEAGCDAARSGRSVTGWLILGAGVVVAAGAGFVRRWIPRHAA